MRSSFPPSKGGNTATADATALPEAGFAGKLRGNWPRRWAAGYGSISSQEPK
jgi:hypothetical protein